MLGAPRQRDWGLGGPGVGGGVPLVVGVEGGGADSSGDVEEAVDVGAGGAEAAGEGDVGAGGPGRTVPGLGGAEVGSDGTVARGDDDVGPPGLAAVASGEEERRDGGAVEPTPTFPAGRSPMPNHGLVSLGLT